MDGNQSKPNDGGQMLEAQSEWITGLRFGGQ